jgi:predicted Zn finger-like uncharacterized protein
MKMSTRCPACGTGFRIYPQQLAARDGQVRCGKCATIFDARSALTTDDDLDPALVVPPPSPYDVPAPPPPRDVAAPPPAAQADTLAREEDTLARVEEELARVEAAVSQPVAPSAPPEPEISVSDDDDDAEFEFGPRARRRSRVVAALWGLGAAALAVVLAGQIAYAYRGELALALPGSQRWIEAACARLGCTIPPPRRAELLSIETSELAAEREAAGVLTLTAALRNRAAFAQAYPYLELTLTDAADRPVARRVLAPGEYLGAEAARAPGATAFAAGAEQAVKLHIDAAGLNASGYRIFLFYR